MRKIVVLLAGVLVCFFHTAFGQIQLISNGGFETGFAPWQFIGSAGAQIFNNPASAHSGNSYLSMGNANAVDQGVFQTISIPSNTISATLSYFWAVDSTHVGLDALLNVRIVSTNGTTILTNVDAQSNLSSPNTGYHQQTFDLKAFAGQTVEVFFEVQTGNGIGIFFRIDDVSVVDVRTFDIPANDYFTNRTVLPNPTNNIAAATNTLATKEQGEPNHAGNSGGHSLWWTWTAPASFGSVKVDTAGNTFFTLLAVYTGSSVSNLTVVASDNGNNNRSGTGQVKFNTTPGTEYQIAVDGFNGDFGAVALSLKFELDTTPPTVSISSPSSNAKLTNSTVLVQGTASDNLDVAKVEYRLENAAGTNDYQTATGTNHWSATVTGLIPGANTVRVRAFDLSTNVSAQATRTFIFVVVSPITLTINGNGTVTPNLNGQLLNVGNTYMVTAKPNPGSVFNGWTGDITASTAVLSFVMQSNLVLQANFIPNPFAPAVGTYQGLFYDTNGVAQRSSGFFSGTVASGGALSAKIMLAGKSYSLSGQFLGSGFFSNSIIRKGLTPLTAQLQLDLAGDDVLTGWISDGTWTAQLIANRATFNAATNPAPQAGKYTLLIPGAEDSSTQPGGDSPATVMVTTSGSVTVAGTLADGSKVSQKTFLSKAGQLPLFASLYSGNGFILGWLTFTNAPDTDIDGLVAWLKLAQPASKLYPGGFTNLTEAMGSRYAFTSGVPVLNFTTGQVWLANGNLPVSFTNQISLGADSKVTNLSSNKLSLTITTSSGLFKGSATDPITLKSIPFSGVVLQKQNFGGGSFAGTNRMAALLSDRIKFGI